MATAEVFEERESGEGVSLDELLIALIERVRTHDGLVRESAREELIAIGRPAVPYLVAVLKDPDWHYRWEAAKALGRIADPAAAPALVASLSDERFGIRWLAASGLIAIRRQGLPPLLHELTRKGDSLLFQTSAHRVLSEILRQGVEPELEEVLLPLLEALEDVQPSIRAPVAARNALDSLAA